MTSQSIAKLYHLCTKYNLISSRFLENWQQILKQYYHHKIWNDFYRKIAILIEGRKIDYIFFFWHSTWNVSYAVFCKHSTISFLIYLRFFFSDRISQHSNGKRYKLENGIFSCKILLEKRKNVFFLNNKCLLKVKEIPLNYFD